MYFISGGLAIYWLPGRLGEGILSYFSGKGLLRRGQGSTVSLLRAVFGVRQVDLKTHFLPLTSCLTLNNFFINLSVWGIIIVLPRGVVYEDLMK